MFRDQRVEEYDNKDWFFVLEDVKDGKRKPVAQEIKLIKRMSSLRPLLKVTIKSCLHIHNNDDFDAHFGFD